MKPLYLQLILVILATILQLNCNYLKSLIILATMLKLNYNYFYFHPSMLTIYNIVFIQERAFMSQ
jgi:hypothetical protein